MAISGLQNPLSSPVVGGVPVGVKAATPAAKVAAPTTTLTKTQTAPAPVVPTPAVSPTYAFSGSLGVGTGQPASAYQAPQTLPQLATANNTPASIPQPPPTTTTPTNTLPLASTTPTTATGAPAVNAPPNNGTTGVSQGSIIGGQIANASNNPDYQKYQGIYANLAKQIADTQTAEAASLGNNASNPIPLEFQTGRASALQSQYGGILQALAQQQTAAQQGINNAIGEQGATTSGLANAGSLNAPVFTTPGQVQVSPSQPTPGATVSGAANINNLVSAGNGSNGHPQGEYFNTQNGQGFSNPQQLADFVNSQVPGANVNASNVFQYLDSQKGQTTGNNIIGGNSSLNPLSNVNQTAQSVVNGTTSYQDALAAGGTIPNYANVLQQAIRQVSPGFNFNTSQGNSAAQQTVSGNQTQQIQNWTSAKQQAQALTGQLQPLLSQINPSQFQFANGIIQAVAGNVSNPTYQQAGNLLTEIANTYAQVLTPPGGTVTDSVRSTATGMIDGLASGQSIAQVIAGLDAQAQAKIGAVPTTSTNGTATGSSSFLQMPANGTTAGGGSIVFQNGKWVAQ